MSSDSIKLFIQGELHEISTKNLSPNTTLNQYLRDVLHLTGTKKMCYEGGCGTCVVVVHKPNPVTGKTKLLAVNSCLVSILTCHGWNIETIEGIGGPITGYDPVQKVLATFNGTQCGFCSPGMVMNMYALSKNNKNLTMKEVENSFGGNICRCTGYRPILAAFKSLCKDASSDLLGKYPDIEDFECQKSECFNKSVCKSKCALNRSATFSSAFGNWTKVTSLKELLAILKTVKDKSYMLVAGNTGKGVYQEPNISAYIDISEVKELITFDVQNDNLLILGGSTSLTDAMKIFYKLGKRNSKFSYLTKMGDHIDLIANVPVRNIGTLAGNLMMKHKHNDFPSDIFLILETFGTRLTIIDTNETEVDVKPAEFLKIDMNGKVIKSIKLYAFTDDIKYETYKIMPRAQNAHALVNAGFVIQFDSLNLVKKATIVYGHINPGFIHALNTEKFVIGKNLFDNKVLQDVLKTLSDELHPDLNPPEPKPEMRKQLALSLFYKTVLIFAPKDKLTPTHQSATSNLEKERPVSNGTQEYETNKSLYPLTQPISKLEALDQTSGQAQYIDDIPDLSDQLFGRLILAEAPPSSVITKIDSAKALAVIDIVGFFQKDDIPGDNNAIPNGFGESIQEEIFCSGTVKYYYQPVAILVGKTKDSLDVAAGLVKISYSSPKRTIYTSARDILKAKAVDRITKLQEIKPTEKGSDVKKVLKGSFDIGGQYHFHMETHTCLIVPLEGTLEMYTTTQWMDLNQIATAKMLKIPASRINVTVRRCGGGFGAKISRNSQICCTVALAAWKLKKPVRLCLTLKENMEIIGARFPLSGDYEVGVNDSGLIQYLTCQMYSDQGVGGNEKRGNMFNVLNLFRSSYKASTFDITYNTVQTDLPAYTWCRAPGTTEGMAYIESIVEHIASELNLDPFQVRMSNISKDQNITNYFMDIKNWADIERRKTEIATFNKENRWKKKGFSVVPMAYAFVPYGAITSLVSIYNGDGSVTITHGGIEIGQGVNTKAAQVCAYRFGIPMEKISVRSSTSTYGANSVATGGSMTSEAVCYGIDKACDELLRRMEPYKTDNQTWEDLVLLSYSKHVHLTSSTLYSPTSPSVGPYLIYGSCATEVLLDVLTGQHQITRVDLIEDTGTTLSPEIDVGQVEGAFVMGLGYYISEKLVFDRNGKILTNNTWFYKPPGAKDIPIDFRVKFPKNNKNAKGIFNSKAVGEPPLCMAVSIPLAIRNAVASARIDADPTNSKWYPFDGPSNVENTFVNSLNNIQLYTL